jgi:hypothetical protein
MTGAVAIIIVIVILIIISPRSPAWRAFRRAVEGKEITITTTPPSLAHYNRSRDILVTRAGDLLHAYTLHKLKPSKV